MSFPHLSDEQRAKWAERLSRRVDRSDSGQEFPLTAAALALEDPVERLVAVGRAVAQEKVIVPINVEKHPDHSDDHEYIDPSADDAPQLRAVECRGRRGVAVYSSAAELRAGEPGARPMRVEFRKVALAALVETGGCVVVNPGRQAVVMPRPLVAALAQADEWLPAWSDQELAGQLADVVGAVGDSRLLGVELFPEAEGAELRVEVRFAPGQYGAADRAWMMGVFEALRGAPRLQASADRVVIVPIVAA